MKSWIDLFFPLFLHSLLRQGCPKRQEDLVAQLVEQYTFNVWALGSSPSQITQGQVLMKICPFFYPFLESL
jgi:hypothetical protein